MAGVVAPTVVAPRVEMAVFDLSWGHLILVGVVALVVIGPKELPGVLRTLGQWTTRIRRMAAEFQGQFQEALREAEMADLHKEIGSIRDTAAGFASSLNEPMHLDQPMKWDPKPASTETPAAETAAASEASTSEASTSETPTPESPTAATSSAETSPAETSTPETQAAESPASPTPGTAEPPPAPTVPLTSTLAPPRFNPEGFEPEVRKDRRAAATAPAAPADAVETAAVPASPDGDAAAGGDGGRR